MPSESRGEEPESNLVTTVCSAHPTIHMEGKARRQNHDTDIPQAPNWDKEIHAASHQRIQACLIPNTLATSPKSSNNSEKNTTNFRKTPSPLPPGQQSWFWLRKVWGRDPEAMKKQS